MSHRGRRTRRGRGALAAGALVVAIAGGAAVALSSGLVVIDRTGNAAAATAPQPDTSAGALERALPGSPAPIRAPLDSVPSPLLAVPPAVALEADSSVAREPGAGPPASGTGAMAVTATPAELSALAARLTVPVAGVRPDQLVDSFDDARGAQDADGARRHDALDILAPRGTPVVAATGGRVLKLFDSQRGGLTAYTTDESERFVLLYGHLDRYAPGLREGARVRQGDPIGFVGTTGNAGPATPQLHFAVARTDDPRQWYRGTPVNPYPLLRGR